MGLSLMNMNLNLEFILNPISDDKILALSKVKVIADNVFSLAQVMQLFLNREENIVEKGENVGYFYFLHFTLFSKDFYLRVIKVRILWQRVDVMGFLFQEYCRFFFFSFLGNFQKTAFVIATK